VEQGTAAATMHTEDSTSKVTTTSLFCISENGCDICDKDYSSVDFLSLIPFDILLGHEKKYSTKKGQQSNQFTLGLVAVKHPNVIVSVIVHISSDGIVTSEALKTIRSPHGIVTGKKTTLYCICSGN